MNPFEQIKQAFGIGVDPNAMDETYGVPNSVVRQARGAQLGQLGANLYAMSQQLTPQQRAQVAQNMAGQGSDFQKNIYNAAQSRLMQQRIELANQKDSREREALARLQEQLQSAPDSPQRRQALAYLGMGDAANAIKAYYDAPKPSATAEKVQMLMSTGMSEQDAIREVINGSRQATTINNILPGGANNEDQLRKKMMEETGTAWGKYEAAGNTAADLRSNLVILDELMQFAPQGPIQGRLAEAFPGFSSAGSAFNSIVKRLAPQMRVEGSGSTSDIEYQGFLDSLPQLSNKPEANRLISEVLKSRADVLVRRSQIVAAYKVGDIDFRQATQMLDELNRQSVVPTELKRMIGGLGTGSEIDDLMRGVPGQ